MPYFVTDQHPDCPAWATVKDDGEVLACHATEQEAIDQMIAVSLSEGVEPGGRLKSEERDADTKPPQYMRDAARRGLEYYEDGLAGDGVTSKTIREARLMAAGEVSDNKWVRIAAWIARHMSDLDAPAANPENDDYPSAGVVAHLLWGSGPSKSAAEKTMNYAEKIVSRLQEEDEMTEEDRSEMGRETRTAHESIEVREEGDGMVFEGYAAIFDSPSQPLPFIEKIDRGAFTRSLKSRNDVKLLWNHDTSQVLGSTRAKTLTLVEDERGLKVQGVLPNTSAGRDAAELLKRGDVDSMSFGFTVIRDQWSADGNERTLKAVRLHEVSIVAFPAYAGTAGTTSVRNLDALAERAQVDADQLTAALTKVEAGEDITPADRDLLSAVINTLAPADEPEEVSAEMLALKKKKLQLLKGL
jgi:HK97 family phage prohead protease